MKKLKLLLIASLVSLTLVGCDSDDLSDTSLYASIIEDEFHDSGIPTYSTKVRLVYSESTKVVYYLTKEGIAPYINENGKYSKFDEETKELIQID